MKLNSLAIQRLKKPGRYGDGQGLYLQVAKGGTKAWLFRFMRDGRSREMGLGPYPVVSLAEARERAAESRKKLSRGNDPIEAKRAEHAKTRMESAKAMTFAECAAAYIMAHRAGWKNAKHAAQWESTLKNYAHPVIGGLAVGAIDTALVMQVLEPIWREKTETASRVRNRIELILDWARVRGYRSGENPAAWRGHLDSLLPRRSSVQPVEHFAALPIGEVGDFMARLRALDGIAARAFEFQILTAARPSEATGAQWHEFDLEAGVWTIPAVRMKAKREHRVPLSPRALEIVRSMVKIRSGASFVFAGRTGDRPLSENSLRLVAKRRMGFAVTAHGFRSTFRDWAGERTNFAREVIEKALAHSLKDATEAAYQRGDLFIKRKALMTAWAENCARAPHFNQVIAFSSGEILLASQ